MPIYGVKTLMRRVRWAEWDSADTSAQVDWRSVAIIAAALFLNFHFFQVHGLDLAGFGPIAVDLAIFAVAAILVGVLFFLGPALAVHARQCTLSDVLEDSLGTIPAVAVRLCSIVFLGLWIPRVLGSMAFGGLTRGEVSPARLICIAFLLVLFLIFTAVQSIRTTGRLALFSSKLGIALLIAALIRVHDGLGAIPSGFAIAGYLPPVLQFTRGFSDLASYAAPFGLFLAEYMLRVPNRKLVSLTVLTGVTLPIFVALSLSGIVGIATAASRLYQPSLNPTIAMALWAHAASSSVPTRILVAGISTFGALRFGLRSLAAQGKALVSPRFRLVAAAFVAAVIAVLARNSYSTVSTVVLEICQRILVSTSAIVTARALMGSTSAAKNRILNPVGVIALASGFTVSLLLPTYYLWADNQWWLPWVLPSYAMTFVIYVAGSRLQRVFSSSK